MREFTVHSGKIAVMNEDNVDTDRIMPARFLTKVERSGYGELLFKDVRGPGFILDQPQAKDASILTAGTNFGCGSSREHAVWGLQQAGFKAIIARKESASPGFSDIFRQNSANCGLLLIELVSLAHDKLVSLGSGAEIKIDLPSQEITAKDFSITFDISPATKTTLIRGLDLIGTTLEHENEIDAFEAKAPAFLGAASRK